MLVDSQGVVPHSTTPASSAKTPAQLKSAYNLNGTSSGGRTVAIVDAYGYPNLERDVLLQFRIHGVTPEYIEELRKLGYAHIPAQKLVEMRIHDVSPEFIRRLAAAGYHQVPIDKMVQMRIFDIKPEMLKALDDASD